MRYPLVERLRANHVRTIFQSSAEFFDLWGSATIGDLAERLCRLGEHHAGALTSVDVRIEPERARH